MKKEEELKNALDEAQRDEILNQEELGTTEGGSWINISKAKCGDTTNTGNCVAGCACSSIDTDPTA